MERPILFSSEMVRAILDYRKTETRRVVNPQPKKEHHLKYFKYLYANVGDILYVREGFYFDEFDGEIPDEISNVYYRADCDEPDCKAYTWKPSIHMPKKFSRIKLKIKEIRVERVQDITEDHAIKEGLKQAPEWGTNKPLLFARKRFVVLWDSLNKKRGFGWDKNPYVWVIKFERVV